MENLWFTFKTPWTRDVEYVIPNTSMVLSEANLVDSTSAYVRVPTKSSFPGGFNEFLGDGS